MLGELSDSDGDDSDGDEDLAERRLDANASTNE